MLQFCKWRSEKVAPVTKPTAFEIPTALGAPSAPSEKLLGDGVLLMGSNSPCGMSGGSLRSRTATTIHQEVANPDSLGSHRGLTRSNSLRDLHAASTVSDASGISSLRGKAGALQRTTSREAAILKRRFSQAGKPAQASDGTGSDDSAQASPTASNPHTASNMPTNTWWETTRVLKMWLGEVLWGRGEAEQLTRHTSSSASVESRTSG